jgi:uncharacterized protein YabN with tetrapyrrole methylase and pyrophosphatase domain
MRAAKLGKRASRIGFDWPDATGVREKLNEELAELDAEIARAARHDAQGEPDAKIAEELGDALFTLVNLGRHLHVDAEEALRAANRKFEARFRQMEAHARARGLELGTLSPAQWDALWIESKKVSDPAA